MKQGAIPKEWIEIGLFTGAAFLLYQISVLFFLMAVPLFLLGLKRGKQAALYGGGILLVLIVVQILFRTRGIEEAVLRRFFIMMELAYPLSILSGVAILNWWRGRSLSRILMATVAVILISLPIAGYYSGNQEVVGFLKEQLQLITESLQNSLNTAAGGEGATLFASLGAEEIYDLILQLFVRNYLFSYFLVISFCWYLSTRLYARMSGGASFQVTAYFVPEYLLWPVIVAWAGVLLDVIFGIPLVGFIFWNYGMILLVIYALQGIGILKYLFGRHGVSRTLQMLIVFSAVIVMATPRINLVLIVGVPLLGLSEYWVHYRAIDQAGESS